jgi:hypothetical protein
MVIRAFKQDRLGEKVPHPEVDTHRGNGIGQDLPYLDLDFCLFHHLMHYSPKKKACRDRQAFCYCIIPSWG